MTLRKLNSGVEDIFDFPKDKNINAQENEKNKERKAYQKSLRIPKTRHDLIDEITDQDQFLALCDSLLNFGSFGSPQTLGEEIVNYLISVESINAEAVRDFLNIP